MSTDRPRFIKPKDDNWTYSTQRLPSPSVEGPEETVLLYNSHASLPDLPASKCRLHILRALETHRALILVGDTATGKTTLVPQFLSSVGHRVCVVLPSPAAALSAAGRVASLRGAPVACRTALTDTEGPDDLVYMTEGSLVRRMLSSPLLLEYSLVMLDEVHERTVLTDLLLGLMLKICKRRKNLKLVLSSATMDVEFMRDFLADGLRGKGTDIARGKETETLVAILTLPEREHHVDVFYLEEPTPDYVKCAVQTAISIHENKPLGDVLVFLTDKDEIHTALDSLQTYAIDNNEQNKYRKFMPSGMHAYDVEVFPLFPSLPLRSQLDALKGGSPSSRRIILTTHIGETSLTFHNVKYVIDCGYRELSWWDPSLGPRRGVARVSEGGARQRAGRAGRADRGEVYRLYTSSTTLPPTPPPALTRSPLAGALLQLLALGVSNVLRFPFPSPPPSPLVLSSLQSLLSVGAITSEGRLTSRGRRMAVLPLRTEVAALLAASDEFGCVEEMLSICAMLSAGGAGQRGGKAQIKRRNHYEVAEGDLISQLNMLSSYRRAAQRAPLANKTGLVAHAMEKACEIRDTLSRIVRHKLHMTDSNPGHELTPISRIIRTVCASLPHRVALRAAGGWAVAGGGAGAGGTIRIDDKSCLRDSGVVDCIVYVSSRVEGDVLVVSDVIAVDRQTLRETAAHYYK